MTLPFPVASVNKAAFFQLLSTESSSPQGVAPFSSSPFLGAWLLIHYFEVVCPINMEPHYLIPESSFPYRKSVLNPKTFYVYMIRRQMEERQQETTRSRGMKGQSHCYKGGICYQGALEKSGSRQRKDCKKQTNLTLTCSEQ